MKRLSQFIALAMAIFVSTGAWAINYEIIGPCDKTAVFSGKLDLVDLKISIGQISVSLFDQQKIPYQGSVSGFNSILNTPIGLDAMEVISDTKMRAYGWCYSVNGIQPEVLADQYFFKNNNDQLVWFYAYSTYDKGVWTDYCVPSYKIKADQFCKH